MSVAEKVSTLLFTSSNSTNPGHRRDSLSKREKPASGCPRRRYSSGVERHFRELVACGQGQREVKSRKGVCMSRRWRRSHTHT